MGTSRCWQDNVVNGFRQSKSKKRVAVRKELKRLEVRKTVKALKAAGKPVDLQAINEEVRYRLGRKKSAQRPKRV